MKTTGLVLALGLLAAPAAHAETDLVGGIAFALGDPQGDFDAAAGTGFGAQGFALVSKPDSPLGLRIDGSVIVYGSESFVSPYPGTGGRVGLDVSTDNWIAHLGIGPQFTVRTGRVRPFVQATAGFSYFATTSDVSSSDDLFPFATSTNFDDWTFRWSAGGGVVIPLNHSIALELGAAWVSNGSVSYLVEGDIVDDGSGGIAFTPRRSDANLVQYTVGISGGW